MQNDNTIGTVLGSEDYQTYAGWGGGGGEMVIGLFSGTQYKMKVKAMHGRFTETEYGPIATASTVNAQISFDIDVDPADTETSPPFAINFGSLVAGMVIDSVEKIWVDFSTNGESGGKVYVYDMSGGLKSTGTNALITGVTGDLAALSSGYGAQAYSVSQSSGGPLTKVSPYDLAGQNVGILDGSIREMFSSSSPVSGGRASFLLKAKSSVVTPAAGDYTDILQVIVSANF